MSPEELFETSAHVHKKTKRFPEWLRRKFPKGGEYFKTDALLKEHGLNLVCEEAKCPNRMECYANKTATFLALGKACTRACGFCDIDHAKVLPPPDPTEPMRIADSTKKLGLKHVVITMVTRDDLPDGGAEGIARIIRTLHNEIPSVTVEVLTSDFGGNKEALHRVLNERPEVFNHNMETTRSLTPRVRHKATYDLSLSLLREAKVSGKSRLIKSGIMVGLGETLDEVHETLRDLKGVGCDCVTIGQYLQANHRKLLVKRLITPKEFKSLEEYGLSIGLSRMFCGPFVRSSYNAHKLL